MISPTSPPDAYAVMGNPIAHSLSPRIHTEFARETGQNLIYTAIHVAMGRFFHAVDAFQAAGGKGLNITLPFKHEAWECVDTCTARADLAGAVNTIRIETDGTRLGDNTDGVGLVRDILDNHGGRIGGCRLLLMGAGGAVRGVLGPILQQRPQQVVIANRTRDKAVALASEIESLGPVRGCGYAELEGSRFDLIINGTAASLASEIPPLPKTVLVPGGWCYDLMYGAKAKPFLDWGRSHGAAVAIDGLGMLVEQAAESFFLWRGVRPDTARVIRLLRDSVEEKPR